MTSLRFQCRQFFFAKEAAVSDPSVFKPTTCKLFYKSVYTVNQEDRVSLVLVRQRIGSLTLYKFTLIANITVMVCANNLCVTSVCEPQIHKS